MKRSIIIFLVGLFLISLLASVCGADGQHGIITDSELNAMRDIAATGEYEGYRKIVGHKLENYYDIYFTYNADSSYHIVTVPLHPLDMNEMITIVQPSGEEQTASRETWYRIFRKSWNSWILSDYLQSHYTQLYSEWAIYDSGIEAENLAQAYIQKNYAPKIDFYGRLQPDTIVRPLQPQVSNNDTESLVKIYDLEFSYYNTKSSKNIPGVRFKIKNDGDKILSQVEVTIRFKDKYGKEYHSEKYIPIGINYNDAESNTLRPHSIWQMKSGAFHEIQSAELVSRMQGSVEAQITQIKYD